MARNGNAVVGLAPVAGETPESLLQKLQILEKEFAPTFNAYDLVNVAKYTAYTKLLIDNTASKPFNMHTYPPQKGNDQLAAAIKPNTQLPVMK